MRREPATLAVLFCLALLSTPALGRAQQSAAAPAAAPAPAPPAPLFATSEPLVFTLETDLRRLLRDRGDKRTEHGATLRYVAAGGDTVSLPVDVRTRGIFRLKQCAFPPLRLDFPESRVHGTVFAGQDKLKLVTHCRGSQSPYEQNVLQEYVLYKIFNVLTERGFRARLAHVTYRDSTGHDEPLTRYGVLLEAEAELARRLGDTIVTSASVHDLLIEPEDVTLVAMFQYLIGNTDWSIWGLHNITIVRDTAGGSGGGGGGGGGALFAIPYDFDFAGVISAPYATTPPQLPIRSVRERLYRGFCQPDTVLLAVLARFRAAKDSIYALYRSVPDLSARDVRQALDYFDGFYRTINDPGAVRREFVRGCRRPS
jgi:hypothetical protein